MSETLRVAVLGLLAVHKPNGERIVVPSSTQRRLLSILVLDVGKVLPADRLCSLMDCSPGSLRTSVSRLRTGLGSGQVRTAPPGYVLVAATDIAEFERLVAMAAKTPGDDAVALLDRALALWRARRSVSSATSLGRYRTSPVWTSSGRWRSSSEPRRWSPPDGPSRRLST